MTTSRSRQFRQRQPQKGNLGWRAFDTFTRADNAARTYIDRCRDEHKPDGFRVLTQKEGGRQVHYPIIVVHDATSRQLHSRSGFRIVGA